MLPQVHLLHGHQLPVGLHRGDAHDPRGPLTDLYVVVQEGPRISRIHHHLQRRSELLVGDPLGLPLRGVALRRGPRACGSSGWDRGPWGGDAGVRGERVLGGLGGQAGVGGVMRLLGGRGLGAGGASGGTAGRSILRGGLVVSDHLEETDRRR